MKISSSLFRFFAIAITVASGELILWSFFPAIAAAPDSTLNSVSSPALDQPSSLEGDIRALQEKYPSEQPQLIASALTRMQIESQERFGTTTQDPAASQEPPVVQPKTPPRSQPSRPRKIPSLNRPLKIQSFIWPLKGILTSGFGWRWGRMHEGIDIAAPIGTPVSAVAGGVVVSVGYSGGYGNLVKIQHPNGSLTLYAHNSRLLVQKGQQVRQGQIIAEVGSTGNSTGPHLHFEVRPKGKSAVNPLAYLPR